MQEWHIEPRVRCAPRVVSNAFDIADDDVVTAKASPCAFFLAGRLS